MSRTVCFLAGLRAKRRRDSPPPTAERPSVADGSPCRAVVRSWRSRHQSGRVPVSTVSELVRRCGRGSRGSDRGWRPLPFHRIVLVVVERGVSACPSLPPPASSSAAGCSDLNELAVSAAPRGVEVDLHAATHLLEVRARM
jgi:hypothetical protein